MQSKTRTIILSAVRTAGWLAGAAFLLGAIFFLEGELNLFNWDPEFSLMTQGCLMLLVAALLLLWFTAKRTRDVFSRFAALLVCLALAALAGFTLRPESPYSGFLWVDRTPSPLWYRAGRSGILLVPLMLWVWFPLRLWCMKRNPRVQENSLGTSQSHGQDA